ncbi:MAG TPA: hypothetical protein VE987_12895 [Polyangiaceae bacterium]|nr:hypothetical protein [Polyangiaceae bacterium]
MGASRIRRRILEPRLTVLDPDDDDRETEDGEPEDEPCLFCTLIDEADDEADQAPNREDAVDDVLRDKLATALAYGAIVFAQGHGVATCDACNDAIDEAMRAVKKEIRKARPRGRAR